MMPAALARAVEGQDVVFHVAGLVAAQDEAEFVRVNRDGTASLVASAAPRESRSLRLRFLDGRRWSGRQGPSANRDGTAATGDRVRPEQARG